MTRLVDSPFFILLIVVVGLMLLELSRVKWLWKLRARPKTSGKSPKPRAMKPKSEKDCPQCQEILGSGKTLKTACAHVPIPRSQKKGKGGRKKTTSTQNYFCSNPVCDYYLIADENVHALVGYGWHGKYEDIQDLLCQACLKKFTGSQAHRAISAADALEDHLSGAEFAGADVGMGP